MRSIRLAEEAIGVTSQLIARLIKAKDTSPIRYRMWADESTAQIATPQYKQI
jgi:hypothetical protein